MERDILIQFYYSTNGDEWTRKDNWCSTLPISEWYGVTASPDGEHVFELKLPHNNLNGKIPEKLGDLSHLRKINLRHNYMRGQISKCLGRLPNLTDLELGYNRFTWNEITEAIKYVNKHKGKSYVLIANILIEKQTDGKHGDYIPVDKISTHRPTLIYQLLSTLEMTKSASTMYIDDNKEPLHYSLKNGSYCVGGSEEKVIENYWFDKFGKNSKSIYISTRRRHSVVKHPSQYFLKDIKKSRSKSSFRSSKTNVLKVSRSNLLKGSKSNLLNNSRSNLFKSFNSNKSILSNASAFLSSSKKKFSFNYDKADENFNSSKNNLWRDLFSFKQYRKVIPTDDNPQSSSALNLNNNTEDPIDSNRDETGRNSERDSDTSSKIDVQENTTWREKLQKYRQNRIIQTPMVSYTLPFQHMTSYYYLRAFVELSDKTGNRDIFDNENVKVAIYAAWKDYGRSYHLWQCLIFLIYYGLVSYSNYAYQNNIDCKNVSIIILVTTSLILFVDYNRAYYIMTFKRYFTSWRNLVQFFTCALIFAGTLLRLIEGETTNSEIIMAWGSIVMWFSALNLLRPFSSTGYLVPVIYDIILRVVPFFFILMLIVYGFSQAFYLLDESGISMQQAYLEAYVFITNGASFTVAGDSKTNIEVFIECIYIAFTQILMLNLLIAFLTHIYSRVQEKADATALYERCRIIKSQWHPFGVEMDARWIHFLKNESDIESDATTKLGKQCTNLLLTKDFQQINNNMKDLEKSNAQLNDKLDLILKSVRGQNGRSEKDTKIMKLMEVLNE